MENVFGVTVHVHPVALMAIVDSHERRTEGSKRAVGTLVGVKEKRGVVVIRNAYPVPHNETEELVLYRALRGVHTQLYRQLLCMFALHV